MYFVLSIIIIIIIIIIKIIIITKKNKKKNNETMKFDTTCSFSCQKGYQLKGPSYKKCGTNSQWTDSAKSVSCKGELKITGVTEKTSSFYFFPT